MRIGTTPTHIFTLSEPTEIINKVEITYEQNGATVLTKTTDDCELEGNVCTVQLTQEDTFLFDESGNIRIQIRIQTLGEDVLSSDVYCVAPYECLSNEVL